MILIREAQARDADALVELARTLHSKSARSAIVFDEDGARELFAKCLGVKRLAPFVAVVREHVVGLVIGCLQRWPYLRGTFVSDLVFFSSYPGAGRKLLARVVEWGREQGAYEAIFSVSYGGKSAMKTQALYTRMGFEYRGGMFAMNLRN